jgi:hypothetical protein
MNGHVTSNVAYCNKILQFPPIIFLVCSIFFILNNVSAPPPLDGWKAARRDLLFFNDYLAGAVRGEGTDRAAISSSISGSRRIRARLELEELDMERIPEEDAVGEITNTKRDTLIRERKGT